MSGRGRRSGLPPEDAALWAKVLAEVDPLPRPPPRAEGPAPEIERAARPDNAARATHLRRSLRAAAPPELATVEARLARRLARGIAAIDGRLDLHGLRQEAAHRRLTAFLAAAQRRGDRLVLVITGKGAPMTDPARVIGEQRGVLRRLVPLWLADPALRPLVIGFSEAHPHHGGVGALYVRLRRLRRF